MESAESHGNEDACVAYRTPIPGGGVLEQPDKMTRFALLLLAVLFSGGAASRTVTELAISETGATQPDVEETCRKFRPSEAQIKRFFLRAYPVEGHVITTERYSPCYAKGTIVFSDRNMGQWWLYSGGTAIIQWNRGGSVSLLHKWRNGWHDPFAGSYGLCGDGTC